MCCEDPEKKLVRANASDIAYDAGGCSKRENEGRKVENGSLLDLSMKRRNFEKVRNVAFSNSRLIIKNGGEPRDYHLEKLMDGIVESPDPTEDIKNELYAGQLVMLKQWNSSKLDTQYSGPYEIQRIKGANVWLKPVNGGAIVKTHRKFLKKMLIDEWRPEKDEAQMSRVLNLLRVEELS